MLNFSLKESYQDSTGYNWDFYNDDQDPNSFYIIPKPQFVLDANGNPSFQILSYTTDGSDSGSGFLRFDVELSVPSAIQAGVFTAIKNDPAKFPGTTNPVFPTLAFNKESKAYFNLTTEGVTTTYEADASDFGGNIASFLLNLTKKQIDTVSASFSKLGGSIDITYYLSVPARLQGVAAQLNFDSSIAYQYQVTQPTYDSWGDQVSPESVTTLLNESASSTVNITWGIPNPPSDLVNTVTTWANKTLASLISAEVQKVIELQGLQSDNSFNINEVSSFTSNFTENMVVAWLIEPKATLPSLADLKLDVSKFITNVNEQQQQMQVSTNLPFVGEAAELVPGVTTNGVVKKAYIQDVTITAQYPTLPQADSSFKFSENGSHTFTADYDTTSGASWNLQYQVNYVDPDMPAVSGIIKGITAAAYTLKVEEAGILSVVFDGTQAFLAEGTKPTELDINFSYVNGQEPQANIIQQQLKIASTDAVKQQTITSLQPMPISTSYNYQVNYVYGGGVVYEAPLVQNQNGSSQIVNAANVMDTVNIVVYVSAADAASNPILEVDVDMWYAQQPTLPPGVANQPTKDAPASFSNITLNTLSTGALMGKASFIGLLSGDQPLMYSANITTATGPIVVNDQKIENHQPTVLVSPTQEYFTLEISPASIDWKSAVYSSAVALVTVTIAQGTAPTTAGTGKQQQRAATWNRGEDGSQYITFPIQTGNVVTYDTEVRYITPGNPDAVNKTTGLTDVLFEIPAKSSSTTSAANKAALVEA